MSDIKQVLITDRLANEAFLTLQGQAFLKVKKSASPTPTAEELDGVHALLIRSQTKIDDELLKNAKNLQVIITSTSGFDHIDFEACAKWGITVMNTPWANVQTTAQLTWALVLASVHKIVLGHQQVKAGEWNRHLLSSMELAGKTYGIIGLGRIGSRVAEIAQSFDMDVIAYDPYCEDKNFSVLGVERAAYEEVLKSADVISFHVPLTHETQHMLNKSQFEYIHRGVVLVNTSRGSVIQEQDLCEALDQGWVGACALDVFEKEPLNRNSHLLRYPNVILSPHVGAASKEAFAKASEQAALKLIQFFQDGTTSDTLPPKAAWYGLDPMRWK